MKIVFLTHPDFFNSRSISIYTTMLSEGMSERGHVVEVLSAKTVLSSVVKSILLKKWLGYFDQYLIFRFQLFKKFKKFPDETLFVFADQALGMFVPLVAHRPHVIHCHDFLALKSSLGIIQNKKVSLTGKIYQNMIRNGFSKGKNFISISQNTNLDLKKFHHNTPVFSKVIYNKISSVFKSQNKSQAVNNLKIHLKMNTSKVLDDGYILHVGVNVWYKNKKGVLEIYNAWRQKYNQRKPLIMVGEPDLELKKWVENKIWKEDIYFLKNVSETLLVSIYSGASVLLFPSFAEGFGWPIAEAMACKCPVITTNEAPMTEVGGVAAIYIPKRPVENVEADTWAHSCANILQGVLQKNKKEMDNILNTGLKQVKKFSSIEFLDQTEHFYKQVLKNESKNSLLNNKICVES